MRLTSTWLTAIVLTLLGGCQTPIYVPPNAGVTAELTVERAADSRAGRLWPYLFTGDECSGRHHIGMMDNNSDAPLITTISANRMTVLQFESYDRATNKSCDIRLKFDPVAGARYRATWASDGAMCFARVDRLAEVSGTPQWVKEPSATRFSCTVKPSF